MVANKLDEVINYSFIHPSAFDKLNLAKTDLKRTAIEITNPIKKMSLRFYVRLY